MKSALFTPRRYQLRKEAALIASHGHPWIFRSHLSTAADGFKTGQWLDLVDATNSTVGYGIYDPEGLIGIRVLKKGPTAPNRDWIRAAIDRALAKREPLRQYTNAFRALHGENDHFPGIVFDVYGNTGVLQTYAPSVDSLGRYVAAVLAEKLQLRNVIWKFPAKRKAAGPLPPPRMLKGFAPGPIKVREGKINLTVDVTEGQKSGAFLDLRGLRKWIASQPLRGMRVLNLFCYTGTLGLAAELAGAAQVVNVDISAGALETAKRFHALDPKKQKFIAADVFRWLTDLKPDTQYDLIIVDPPNMTSQVAQIPVALKTYRRLYRSVLPHLAPKGILVGACCTSRITRPKFRMVLDEALASLKRHKEIAPEDDHPVGFPEGDYLKIMIYRR